MLDSTQQTQVRWRLPALVLTIIAIVVFPVLLLRWVASQTLAASELVTHTSQVEARVHALTYDVRDMEAATLALASGIDTPLIRTRLHDSRIEIPRLLGELIALTRDNPSQQVRMGTLKGQLDARLRLVDRIVQGTDRAQIASDVRTQVTQYPIRELTAQIQSEEASLLRVRSADVERLRTQAAWFSWAAMLAQISMLGLVTFFSQRQIGRRLHAERETRSASERAQAVLQTVREPIVLLDADQRVLMRNPAFSEMFDGGADESTLLTQVGDGTWDNPVILQRLRDVLHRGRELWDFEHVQRLEGGGERTLLINARPMPLPDREEPVLLMTISDISARKAAENHVQELNRQLEGKVEQVSEINLELEAFSYSVSHDLRAPLRHISGFADKLGRHLGDEADEKSRHYLQTMASSAKRMSTLIDDLLVYSRLGRSAMRLQAVDMQSLVAEARSMLDANMQSDQPGHRIEWRVAPLPILVADENMIRQVWLNLLGNAVKYSSNRDVAQIEVNHKRLEDGSHEFSVRDNGAGFDMEYAGKLFGVFQRLHKASEYSGTGIGLASVRRILLRHGGRIWAEAVPDAGATFHFSLPVALDAPNPSLGTRT